MPEVRVLRPSHHGQACREDPAQGRGRYPDAAMPTLWPPGANA